MATNFLIALATAFGSATVILLVVRLLLKVFAPDAFKEMIPISEKAGEQQTTAVPTEAQAYVDEVPAELSGSLSGSQTELISLLAKGWTNKEIARDLNLSEYTVRSRIHRILRKLDAESQTSKQQHKLLEDEVVEHGETLKLNSRQVEAFEKRLRRLEIESVQKRQEATEENLQPPQQVVH